MKRTTCIRMDRAVALLLKCIEDKIKKITDQAARPRVLKSETATHNEHRDSLKMDFGLIWKMSESGFLVKDRLVMKEQSENCGCDVVCRMCKICYHQYSCSCNTYQNENIICRHIHYFSNKDSSSIE